MSLPIDFVASATALECYASCPRRFRQRYIDRLPTAGPDSDSAARMRRGSLFHQLVLWDGLGLDTSAILDAEDDPELTSQWSAYQVFRGMTRAEGVTLVHDQVLSARCAGYQVQARLDAIATTEGEVTIFDWKTSARPDHARLAASPQSKVYPYVVSDAMRRREGVQPALKLVYWFAEAPDDPLRIDCTPELLEEAARWLERALRTIAADSAFEMTHDRRTCRTCEYVAHCGVQAEDGPSLELDEDYYYLPDAEEDSPFIDVDWQA